MPAVSSSFQVLPFALDRFVSHRCFVYFFFFSF